VRELRLILLAAAIVGPLVYFVIPLMGYPLKPWALVVVALLAGGFAALFVLMGETIIEDAVKSGLTLVIAGILWFTTPKSGFIFIGLLAACLIGTLLNQIARAARKQETTGPE